MLGSYQDQFMNLTKQEENSLMQKMEEYKTLVKKSTFLHFMLMNMDSTRIHLVIDTYLCFRKYTKQIAEGGKISNLERISDFDTIGFDVIQVFIIQHIQNMV